MRKRIFDIIEKSDGKDTFSSIYDFAMIITIIISIIPSAVKEDLPAFVVIDRIAVSIFILDYLLRLITADYKYNNRSISSFIRYPFSLMALIDMMSILPSLAIISKGFKVVRVVRIVRVLRVLREKKSLRYSKNLGIIVNVIRKSKDSLIAVVSLAAAYILVSALVIFSFALRIRRNSESCAAFAFDNIKVPPKI